MGAQELFDSGNLPASINLQDVKDNPRHLKSRIFLFELRFSVDEFEGAGRQLGLAAQIGNDVKIEMDARMYRGTLQAESVGRGLFDSANPTPKFFAKPPPVCVLHVDGVGKLRENSVDEGEKLPKKVAQGAGGSRVKLTGKRFDDFRTEMI